MSEPQEVAPNRCIVCGTPAPEVDAEKTWSYIAGSTPIGALVCSSACLAEAMRRHSKTGRVDAKDGPS